MTRPRDLLGRLTGISTPFGGVSWQPRPPETEAANRVLAFLEDRRVLYEDFSWEVPDQCIESVLRIREVLTREIGNLSPDSQLAANLRAINAACRRFLRHTGADVGEPLLTPGSARSWHRHPWRFESSLGELRASIEIHVAVIAQSHGLAVPDPLVRLLPDAPDQ